MGASAAHQALTNDGTKLSVAETRSEQRGSAQSMPKKQAQAAQNRAM